MNIYDKSHPHNAVFVAQLQSVIEGRPRDVQIRAADPDIWRDLALDPDGFCPCDWLVGSQYRLAPRTVTRTITYPEPMRVAPRDGSKFWTIEACEDDAVASYDWEDSNFCRRILSNNTAFATESDAKAAAAAIFGGEA